MNLRDNVVLPGVPFTWTTNLSDDDLKQFYAQYSREIQKRDQPRIDATGVIDVTLFAFLDFLDGVCFWSASDDHHTVLYRSMQDWEMWHARQAEIEELREEQANERAVQRQLLVVEDRHLGDRTDAAIERGEYDLAAGFVVARVELRLKFANRQEVPPMWDSWRSQFALVFTRFATAAHGIEFLRKYNATPRAFGDFAHWFASYRSFKGPTWVEETKRIYEEGMKLFPDDGMLAKDACLFWRCMGRYDLAMKICAEAARKGLRDGTKSGFEGRMMRLERESKRSRLK